MKILTAREVILNPFSQLLTFEDGTIEVDHNCTQTTPILTAEQYNGTAAKDDAGNWVPAPGPSNHQYDQDLLGFRVGLTMIGVDSDGKAIFDYSVLTPTGVWFHGNGEDNTLHVPSNWPNERVAAEIVMWHCLDKDDISVPDDVTPEQWEWINSYERETASADVDEWLAAHDKPIRPKINQIPAMTTKQWVYSTFASGATDALMDIGKAEKINEMAERYCDKEVIWSMSTVVSTLLEVENEAVSWDNVMNYEPSVDLMDGQECTAFIENDMEETWRDLLEDDYTPEALTELQPSDLDEADIEHLRDYIRDNYTPREVLEWWLVTEWLAEELFEINEVTVEIGANHFWGRRQSGQHIVMDGTLQKIAAKYI